MNPLPLDHAFFQALLATESSALERILAHDFILIDVNSGSEITRLHLLAAHHSGGVTFHTIDPSDQHVRRYPATIIITGRTQMTGTFGSVPFAAHSRYTHVYVEQHGEWRLVAAQGTPISPPVAPGESAPLP